MKNKDQELLEEAYSFVRIKHFLLSEGYTEQEIQMAIDEGRISDLLKKAGSGLKKLGLAAVISSAMLGSNAQAAPSDIQAKSDQIEQSTQTMKQEANIQLKLSDMASRCTAAWKKQDFNGLRKIREELKQMCDGIKDNKELDALIDNTNTSETSMLNGLHLLKTSTIGN